MKVVCARTENKPSGEHPRITTLLRTNQDPCVLPTHPCNDVSLSRRQSGVRETHHLARPSISHMPGLGDVTFPAVAETEAGR